MTKSYDPYQNAVAERVNGILKQEFMIDRYKDQELNYQVSGEIICGSL